MIKTNGKILIVDDDQDVLATAKMFLKQYFSTVQTETDPKKIGAMLTRERFDVVLLDMNFAPGESDGREGFYWLGYILDILPESVVILITAYGEVELAVEAMKKGATDFVTKPWKNEKLLATVHTALQLSRSRQEVHKLKTTQKKIMEEPIGHTPVIGESARMKQVLALVEKVAKTDANILILGENGTGKEVIAREVHRQSARKQQALIKVDLGALSSSLFESELFGHVRGAFTDAKEDRAGCFEIADKGTLFLDEIGNLPLSLQVKLLSVIQNREVRRVGSAQSMPIDFRLVTATNMPLYQMVDSGEFRRDLLYRINTVEIELPPLRERAEDIPAIGQYFLGVFSKKYNKQGIKADAQVWKKAQQYHWPGNVRELEHALERAVILSDGKQLIISDLTPSSASNSASPSSETLTLEEMEQQYIREVLEKNQGNVTKTAKELGLTRTALYRRLNRHGL